MRLNIAHVVCVFPPYKGGIGALAAQNARILARAGHQVTVFTPHYDSSLPAREEREGYAIERLPALLRFGNAAFAPSIYAKLKNFDVVHLHYPFFGVSEIVWLLKMVKGKSLKLVMTYHMDVVGRGLLRWGFSAHRALLMKRIVNSADMVIGTSLDYLRHSDIAALMLGDEKKFIAIPPAIDTHHFSPKEHHSVLEKYGIDQTSDRVIIFVGGMDDAHYFKGLHVLLEALRKVASGFNLKALLVGAGNLQSTYRSRAEELGIADRVIFAGAVSYQELPEYYSAAELLVLPSIDKSEAFGIVSAEALSCGTPVLVAQLPGVRTLAEGGTGEVFVPGDPDALALRLVEMLNNPEMLREMGMLGRKKVLEQYSEEVVLEKLLNVYKSIQ